MKRIVSLLLFLFAASAEAQNFGPITAPQVNQTWYAGNRTYLSLQSAVTAACATSAGGEVVRQFSAFTSDNPAGVTGGCTKVMLVDKTAVPAVNYTWNGSAYLAATSGAYLPLAGGTMLGPIQLSGDPSSSTQAATKHYVDTQVATALPLAGGTMTGSLNAPSVNLSGDPSSSTQAATKHYVDTQVATALPLAGGTMTGSLNAPSVNGIQSANSFAGADACVKVNACLASVITAGGGTCDARGLIGSQTANACTINVGSSTSSVPNNQSVELVLPETAIWNWHNMTSASACGIKIYNGGIVTGGGVGGGGNRMQLTTDSSDTAMDSMVCTDPAPTGGGSYIRASGFVVKNNGATPFTNGEMDIQALYDSSDFSYISAFNSYGDAWHISNVCCGTRFTHIQGSNNYTVGSGLVLGTTSSSTQAVTFSDSTFNFPGVGQSDIVINGGSFGGTNGITFQDVYMEGNQSIDTTTAMVTNNGGQNIAFIGGSANGKIHYPVIYTKPVFLNNGTGFSVQNFSVVNLPNAITDTYSGTSTAASGMTALVNGNTGFLIPMYHSAGNLPGTSTLANVYTPSLTANTTVYGNLFFTNIGPPTMASSVLATTGGTLSDSTTYGYRVTAVSSPGESIAGTETSVTTGSSGSNANTVTLNWQHVAGAIGYRVYGRTVGAELLLATVTGDGVTTYTDTGAGTPSGAIPTGNNTPAFVSFGNLSTKYWQLWNTNGGGFRITDITSGFTTRLELLPGGLTSLRSNGSQPINLNYGSGGTGGLAVYGGNTTMEGGFSASGVVGSGGNVVIPAATTGYTGTGPVVLGTGPTLAGLTNNGTSAFNGNVTLGSGDSLILADAGTTGSTILQVGNNTDAPGHMAVQNQGSGSGTQRWLFYTPGGFNGFTMASNGLSFQTNGGTPESGLTFAVDTSDPVAGTETSYNEGRVWYRHDLSRFRMFTAVNNTSTFPFLSDFGCNGTTTAISGTPSVSTYLRGDCSWQPGAVASVFGQTGAIANLSGDVTTSGSSATTVKAVNGAALPTSASYVGTDASGHIIAASTPGGAVASVFGQTGAVPNLSGDVTTSGSSAATVKKINGQPISNVPVMVWSSTGTCPMNYGTCGESAPVSFPYPINLVAFTAAFNTPPAGCTTTPSLQIYSGTAYASISLVNGTGTYTGTISTASVPANTSLVIRTGPTPAGCTATASNPTVNVTYTMQ